jgi:hypothetical protein
MEMSTFTALAERAGRWWTVRVPQIDGLAVQVRSLDQAEMMVRRHIAEALRVPPESVRVEVRTDAATLPAVSKALQARQAAAQAADAAARATRAAIEALLADGSTFQEAVIVLGLTPQEAAELAPGARRPAAGASRASGPLGAPGGPGVRGAPGPVGASSASGGGASGGPGDAGAGGRLGGPRARHANGDAERPIGPSGLPMRTGPSGPPAEHR